MTIRKKPLTILQILPSLNLGGVERCTVDVAKFLKQQGHKAIVASAGGQLCSVLLKNGIEHINLPVNSKNPISLWLNSIRVAKIIRQYKVDIVHARSRAPAWSAYWACKKNEYPLCDNLSRHV